jgi:hypothetical protein
MVHHVVGSERSGLRIVEIIILFSTLTSKIKIIL